MSSGPRYKSEFDALVSQSVQRLKESTVTSTEIVQVAKGLVAGAESSGLKPPFRILVPHDTNLGEHEEGENVTLEQRLKDLPNVKEVKVQRGRGVSIESIGQEDEVKNQGG